MKRRLAAIVAADVAGYSRLMGRDETGTLAALKGHIDELFVPEIAEHDGRIVKLTGDGILCEFASVVDAVACAVTVQEGMVARNEAVAAEDRIAFRIGVNLGDVIVDGDDIYGDGVNVAGRLEGIAPPGGIYLSGPAYDQLGTKLPRRYEYLGERRVKNIDEPVRVYSVRPTDDAVTSLSEGRRRSFASLAAAGLALLFAAAMTVAFWWNTEADEKGMTKLPPSLADEAAASVVVLAFRDLKGDGADEYLATGVTEDVVARLSTHRELVVMAPNTVTGSASAQAPDRVARGYGASHAVLGSLLRRPESIRVNARLVDAETGANIWGEVYEVAPDRLFSVGARIADGLLGALPGVTVGKQNVRRAPHFPDPEAYDLVLRGNMQLSRLTPDSLREATELYRRAVDIDPDYPRAVADIAFAQGLIVSFGWSDDPAAALNEVDTLANRALAMDPSVHQAHIGLGLAERAKRRYGEAIVALEKAIEIAPNSADAYAILAPTYVFAGRPEEGFEASQRALLRRPDRPFTILYTRGMALFHLGRYAEAIESLQEALRKNADFMPPRLLLASALAHLDRLDDAAWELTEVLTRYPDFSLLKEQLRTPYSDPNELFRYMSGLREAEAAGLEQSLIEGRTGSD